MRGDILFSIVIPAYKSKYLCESIDSILCQTYSNFELIVLDDNSPECIGIIVNRYADDRIKYYKNDNNVGAVNVVDNWNKCLSLSSGDYIICMGDDDKLLPKCLESYYELIQKYPDIGLLHGWTEIIDEYSNVIEATTHRCEYESAASLAWHRWHAYSLQFIGDFCMNAHYLKKVGGFFKLPLAWASDDITSLLCAQKNGVANTQAIVFQYRRNNLTISSTGKASHKLDAVNQEETWYNLFFVNLKTDNHLDTIYIQQMMEESHRRFERKRGIEVAEDLKKSRLRIFGWLFLHKKYHLTFSSIVFAFMHSCR